MMPRYRSKVQERGLVGLTLKTSFEKRVCCRTPTPFVQLLPKPTSRYVNVPVSTYAYDYVAK
jgi:hypothetical protein